MPSRCIAVFDVGKTNKKILIFDENLRIIDSVYKKFDERIEGSIHFEPIHEITAWLTAHLKTLAAKHRIKAISVTTHGATAVCLDKNGELATPPVAYTTDAGEKFSDEFYRTFGSRERLQRATATAEVGSLINVAKKLYFIKKTYPRQFANVALILNYPQYFGYVLTGKAGAEPTYMGCHTYLLDFEKRQYSAVARKLGIADKLPSKISKSWKVLGTVSPKIAAATGLPRDCIVTMGIHDSNSSLLPYLVKGYKNFVLNSTGTWCVAMHPTKTVHFGKNELGRLVYYNLDAFNNPVKTSIFMGGLEFEAYASIIGKLCKREGYPDFDLPLYRKIVAEQKLFILPSVVKGTGIFPNARPRAMENGMAFPLEEIRTGKRVPAFFRQFETAHAVLAISLAIQTKASLEMVGFSGKGSIFTEGGFRKNNPYNALVAALFPDAKVALTKLEEATAFGAAMLAKAALDKTTPRKTRECFEIEIIGVKAPRIEGLDAYAAKFMKML